MTYKLSEVFNLSYLITFKFNIIKIDCKISTYKDIFYSLYLVFINISLHTLNHTDEHRIFLYICARLNI
jgi:hypothetical protein